jgi:hypothetical protein
MATLVETASHGKCPKSLNIEDVSHPLPTPTHKLVGIGYREAFKL